MFNFIPLDLREFTHTNQSIVEIKDKYNFCDEFTQEYGIDENDLIESILNLGSISLDDCCHYSF